jgi:hypothetical protein
VGPVADWANHTGKPWSTDEMHEMTGANNEMKEITFLIYEINERTNSIH